MGKPTGAEGSRPRLPPSFEVLLITPEGVTRAELARVIERGARVLGSRLAVQARAKSSHEERVRVATDVASLAASAGVPWFVNGDPALALALGAHLHVPGSLAPEGLRARMHDAWISRAAHTDADVDEAAAAGFDAVVVSPIFEVPGKGAARGEGAITHAAKAHPGLYVIALGGIDAGRASACFEAGAHAVAVMRAPFSDAAFFERLPPRRA